MYWVLYFVLIINISEATIKDMTLGNYFNGVCGVFLLLSQPLPDLGYDGKRVTSFMGIDSVQSLGKARASYFDFIYVLPFGWSLVYSTWNLCFCLDSRRSHFASAGAVLFVPLVRACYHRRYDMWMQSRVYTLALRYVLLAYYDVYDRWLDTTEWYDASTVEYWGLANMVLGALHFIWWVLFCTRAIPDSYLCTPICVRSPEETAVVPEETNP